MERAGRGPRALARLAESVTAGASRAGAPPPDRRRRFQPHLTLARCRIPADVTPLVAALAGYQGPPWTADRLHLVRSRLSAGAARVRHAGELAAAGTPGGGNPRPEPITRTG